MAAWRPPGGRAVSGAGPAPGAGGTSGAAAIALARYPGRFEWSSAAGVIYLAFLIMILATGGVALARARLRPGAPAP